MRAVLILTFALLGLAGPAAAACRADLSAATGMTAAVNTLRAKAGLAAVQVSDALNKAAAAHVCDMASRGFFDHKGSDGSTIMTRIRRAGCRPRIAAENIAWGFTDPGKVLSQWMGSAGHRQNILHSRVRQVGIAQASGGGRVYWVMTFGAGC